MAWRKFFVAALVFELACAACGRSPRSLEGGKDPNDPVVQIVAARFENEVLRKMIDEHSGEMAECNRQKDRAQGGIDFLNKEIRKLRSELKEATAPIAIPQTPSPPLPPARSDAKTIAADLAGRKNQLLALAIEDAGKKTKDQLAKEAHNIQSANQGAARQLRDQESAADQCAREAARLRQEEAGLKTEFAQLKSRREALAQLALPAEPVLAAPRIQEATISSLPPRQEAAAGPAMPPPPDARQAAAKEAAAVVKSEPATPTLKIKVLGGKGKLVSARKMAAKVSALGYKVSAVDLASRNDFTAPTVYYAEGFRPQAQKLAKAIGHPAAAKPLTWSTVFHVIIVTGD